MSIFSSKKPKPKEIDADRSKQRPVATNASKAQPNGQGLRNGTAAISNAALSAGARTIQRAQIMAASRKRMDSDTPDYSIQGAAKGPNGSANRASLVPNSVPVSAARLAAQGGKSDGINGPVEQKSRTATMPNRLSKSQPSSNGEKKSRAGSMANLTPNGPLTPSAPLIPSGPPTPIHAALSTSNASPTTEQPNGIINSDRPTNANLAVHKTPLMPMDSPTLGYDGSFEKPAPRSTPGSGLATSVSNANSHTPSGSDVVQDVRVGRLSYQDSGSIPKPSPSKAASYDSKTSKSSNNAEKSTVVHPGVRAESKVSRQSSRSSTFVSKLDPGPTNSPFAEPVESPTEMTPQPTDEDENRRPRQTSRPQKFQLPESKFQVQGSEVRKEASIPASDKAPPRTDPPFVKESSSKGLTRIVAASQATHVSQMHSSASQSHKQRKPVGQSPRSANSPANSRGIEFPQEAIAKADALSTASPLENPGAFRTAPTSKSNTPPQSSDSKDRGAPSNDLMQMSQVESYFNSPPRVVQEVQPAVIVNPALPQPATTRSSISEPRPALPPVSILEGFKVNKRGHVLDEEGEIIGELFEGDLIDCVRQKVDANGDVLDESGVPVGRVRTIVKGTIFGPRWSISSGVSLPLSTYNWGRRDSTVSQHTHHTHQTQLSQSKFFNRAIAAPIAAPAVEGNAIVAELDASTEAEASPVIDQSEIFSPFGVPKRPDSASTTNSRAELPTESRSNSESSKPEVRRKSTPNSSFSKPESRRESVSAAPPPMPKPVRKWTSRYFESNPLDTLQIAEQGARRNSATADMVASPTSIAGPKTTSIYGAVSPTRSRAVIGPTLESLLEQDPSLFSTPSTKPFGGSTPNLPLEQPNPNPGPTATRRASTQFGAPAPGLAGSRLSVKGAGYQPSRRSPLASYETTPPGSGTGAPEDGQDRARSLPPAQRRPQNNQRKVSMESNLAAPAPEISKTRGQQKRAYLTTPEVGEKRRSRFSFNFGRRPESTAA